MAIWLCFSLGGTEERTLVRASGKHSELQHNTTMNVSIGAKSYLLNDNGLRYRMSFRDKKKREKNLKETRKNVHRRCMRSASSQRRRGDRTNRRR